MKSLTDFFKENMVNELITPISAVVATVWSKQYNDERDRRRKQKLEQARIKTTKIRGSKHFRANSNEYSVNINVTSSSWHKTSILNNKVTAFWTPDSEWIVYYYDKTPDAWAAVAHGTLKPKDYDENMFKDFDTLCTSGATVPEFDDVDTDLK